MRMVMNAAAVEAEAAAETGRIVNKQETGTCGNYAFYKCDREMI